MTAPTTNEVLDRLSRVRVHPVIVIDDAANAVPLARALADGGVPVVEITLRTPCALDVLRAITRECPDVLAGAGTVLTPEQATQARDAGARFFVTPGYNGNVVEWCAGHDVPIFPGICTPTELETALRDGLHAVKFFPAEPMGGAAYLKVMASPYAGVSFLPSGGITLQSLHSYLALGNVVSCGSAWLAPREVIRARDFRRIREEAARTTGVVRDLAGAA